MNSKLLFLFFSLTLLVVAIHALNCYSCDSSDADGCDRNRNFHSIGTETCKADDNDFQDIADYRCYRMSVKLNDDEEVYVIRGCDTKIICGLMAIYNTMESRNFTVNECYVCDTDLCNTRRKQRGSVGF